MNFGKARSLFTAVSCRLLSTRLGAVVLLGSSLSPLFLIGGPSCFADAGPSGVDKEFCHSLQYVYATEEGRYLELVYLSAVADDLPELKATTQSAQGANNTAQAFTQCFAPVTDTNFTVIAAPTIITPPTEASGGHVTPLLATDANALLQNDAVIAGTIQAAETSYERAESAAAAGQVSWEEQQSQAADLYLSEVGILLSKEIGLLLNLYTDTTAAGFSVTLTQADVSQIVQQLSVDSVSAEIKGAQEAAGLTKLQSTFGLVGISALVPSQVAGTFPDTLVSPSFLSAINSAAQDFTGTPILVDPATRGLISSESGDPVTVVVLGTQALNVNTIGTLRFGPNAETPLSTTVTDYNGDGIPDLVLTYSEAGSGLQPGATIVGVYGTLNGGSLIHGSSPIAVQ
jgi:hypothetical protein